MYKKKYKKNIKKSAYWRQSAYVKDNLAQWIKIKSPYNYKQKKIKKKTPPHWVALSLNKRFIQSKNPWLVYYDRAARSYRYKKKRKKKYNLKIKKNIYSLFGFTNYVFNHLSRKQFPRVNHLRKKKLNKKIHKKLIQLQFSIPNELYFLDKPWRYKSLPVTLLRNFIKDRYRKFYKIVGKKKIYKLKFFNTLQGQLLKNSSLIKIDYLWNKLLWQKNFNKPLKRKFTKKWSTWWTTLWNYRTSVIYTQLYFYKKKKVNRFIFAQKPHVFRSPKKEQLSAPWRDALIFKRYLYINNIMLIKNKSRKIIKPAIRFKNPLKEKKNKIFNWLATLLNNRKGELIQKNKKLRIKELLKRIILSFYGKLKDKHFYYLRKKTQVLKSKTLTKQENLLKNLELRLDVIVYRLNLAPSIYWAQQLVKCGQIYVANSNNSKDWQKIYQSLWITSFSLHLRDPKSLYNINNWLNKLPLFNYKHITLPITQSSYRVKPGMIIYTSPNTCLNKFKHNHNLFKKIVPSYLMTTIDLNFTWNMKNNTPTALSTTFWQKEYKHPLASLVLFNPIFSDFEKNDRIKSDSIEWIAL